MAGLFVAANGILLMPIHSLGEVLGELFCAGQCWMPDGRLLVAESQKRCHMATPLRFSG